MLYVNTFGHQYALDDIAAVGQNLFVKKGIAGIPDLMRTEFWHFSNISLGYYRPFSLITFALEQEYFKDNPHISHMINAGLYGLTGLVIGILLQKWLTSQTIIAFLIGLVFITHPLHTEIVDNIKGRDEILSFLFIALMLLAYWKPPRSQNSLLVQWPPRRFTVGRHSDLVFRGGRLDYWQQPDGQLIGQHSGGRVGHPDYGWAFDQLAGFGVCVALFCVLCPKNPPW